eukprot:GFYU01005487.1.p2 GENE.GFYU01005487.1~~GFYU01005487.1.p2  ORF type:complete len:224 (-),score=58.81 GFYU01005487.1:153-824(-)
MVLQRVLYNLGRSLRETGQALDRLGNKSTGSVAFRDHLSRHRPVMNLFDKKPHVANDAFVAPTATVVGDVLLGDRSSVWYGSVIRGDFSMVRIGANTNIQDRAVIQASASFPTEIGTNVTVGHGATLRGCTVEDESLIGMGAIVLDGAIVEKNSMVAAGAVVQPESRVGSGELWAGNPATFQRKLSMDEVGGLAAQALQYTEVAEQHKAEFLPHSTAYQSLKN